jgi:hypothetical protein
MTIMKWSISGSEKCPDWVWGLPGHLWRRMWLSALTDDAVLRSGG